MTCAKQTVTATIVTPNGERFVGTNLALEPQTDCPRGDMPSGVGYELCKSVCRQTAHAEINAIAAAGEEAKGATLYLEGHSYACAACTYACEVAGIASIIIAPPPTQPTSIEHSERSMNDTATAAPMREDVTHEMALFEQHFQLSDRSKYSDGQVVAGRVRYAETNVDKMFTAWLASVDAHAVRPNTKDVVGEQGNHDCLAKRAPDEPYFVILARDPDGPTIVELWSQRRRAAGGDPEHCKEVDAIAAAMRAWRAGPNGFGSKSAPEPIAYSRPNALDHVRRALQQVCDEIAPAKAYAESCGLEGGRLPSAVHIKLDMIHGYAGEGLAALMALSPAAAQLAKRGSRFDPPGLWESEPRSSADDAGEVQS